MFKTSIIIPFRDKVDLLNQCISSILEKSTYIDFEIILVNNNSQEKKTFEYLDELKNIENIKILKYSQPFNFSAINNFAAQQASGEYILFLNNDTEILSENWLEEMLKKFEDPKVGAVGAKLLYSNGTIQHVGVILEEKRLAIHAFRTWKERDVELDDSREWSAVTAACMMTRKNVFEELGGFDEQNLPIAYNDVDYCLRLRERGYRIIIASKARLYHFESASRKNDASIFAKIFKCKRYKQFLAEQNYMRKRWSKEITSDLFYNKNYI
jgi:GT2 family glycosyltransferase